MALDMRFTKPTGPLFIEFESDASDYEFLFIISTTSNTYDNAGLRQPNNLKKRPRVVEETADAHVGISGEGSQRAIKKRPEHIAGPSSSATALRQESSVLRSSNVYRDPSPGPTDTRTSVNHATCPPLNNVSLFLPGASQLSNPDTPPYRRTSEVEHFAYEDFEAMMDDGDADEIGMSTKIKIPMKELGEDDDMTDDGMFPATQCTDSGHRVSFD